MNYFFEGAIKSISDTQDFGGKFKKREFVVVSEGTYPQAIKFEFIQDNVDVLDKYVEGEAVTVAFILKGNEYQGKHYVSLQAIAIGPIEDGRVEEAFDKANKKANVAVTSDDDEDEPDDLPF